MSIAEKTLLLKQDFDEVYEAGYEKGKSEGGGVDNRYDAFWDAFQNYGNRYHWNNAFFQLGWNDVSYGQIKYPITEIRYGRQMFMQSSITDTLMPLDFSNVSAQPVSVFDYCTRLATIRTLTVGESNTFSNWFRECNNLENITFEGVIGKNELNFQWSTKLSHDSLVSIINCLQDKSADTSGTVWKVIVGSTNYAKLTDEDLINISEKGWVFE